ncbi:hypothetical protein Tco_0122938 [Tanacetum coccineum]
MVKALLLDKKNQSPAPTPVKAVEESCVTCGGAHSYQTCPATSGNVMRDNIQEYVSQAAAANFNQGNTGYRAQISNQIRPPGFPPVQNNHVQNQGNNQNRYNQNRGNFNQAPAYQSPVHQVSVPFKISEPICSAKRRYMYGGKDQFPADFVGEITLRVDREAITFNLDQTLRYTADYDHMTANRIDVIDMACEEYSQESSLVSQCDPRRVAIPLLTKIQIDSTVSPT